MKYKRIAEETFEGYKKSRHARIYFCVHVESATGDELRKYANTTKARLWDIQYRQDYQMLVFEKDTGDSYECKTRDHRGCASDGCFCPCHASSLIHPIQ